MCEFEFIVFEDRTGSYRPLLGDTGFVALSYTKRAEYLF